MSVLDRVMVLLGEDLEVKGAEWDQKAGVRRVRDAAFWGKPVGTIITPGMRPKGKKKIPVKVVPKKPREIRQDSGRRAPRPAVGAATESELAKQRRSKLPRAFGSADTVNGGFQRNWSDVKKGQQIEYVSPAELRKVRELTIERARNEPPRPSKYDIADNKRINKAGGAGNGSELDSMRGNERQRQDNAWATYVNFGGYNERSGKDKGYVPCVGCGLKMTWHNNARYSKFPKFEMDKIATTQWGGQYNPQNLVPMCAGCNAQRGAKDLWDAPVLKGAKPKWLTPTFREEVARTRAGKRPGNSRGEYGRPAKVMPATPIPIPPGKDHSRAGKDFTETIMNNRITMRAKSMFEEKADPVNPGETVTAKRYNYDGRHNSAETFPPDVENPREDVTGTYVTENVDSAFGSYVRHVVVSDTTLNQVEVEPATIKPVGMGVQMKAAYLELKLAGGSNGPATGASNALNKYWTSGAGLARWASTATPYRSLVAALRKEGVPAHMVNGLAAKYYKKVKGVWPGKRKATDILEMLEQKAIRRVRTPEGVRKFKLPIGSIIIGNGEHLQNLTLGDSPYSGFDQVTHTDGRTMFIGRFPDETNFVVTDANDNVLHEGKKLEDMFRWANYGDAEKPAPKPKRKPGEEKKKTKVGGTDREVLAKYEGQYLVDGIDASIKEAEKSGENTRTQWLGHGRINANRNYDGTWRAYVSYTGHLERETAVDSPAKFDNPREAVEHALSQYTDKLRRFNIQSDEPLEDGTRHVNARPKDYDSFLQYHEGLRGVDWWEDGDPEIDVKNKDERWWMAEQELEALGLPWTGTHGDALYDGEPAFYPNLSSMEALARTFRAMETMYPGFRAALLDGIHLDNHTGVKAYNGGVPLAYNRTSRLHKFSPGGARQFGVLGLTEKYWGESSDYAWTPGSAYNAKQHDLSWPYEWHANDVPDIAERMGVSHVEAAKIGTIVHEVGHSVGFIMWNELSRERIADGGQYNPADPSKFIGSDLRADLIDILNKYKMVGPAFGKDIPSTTDQAQNHSPSALVLNRDAVAEHLSTYGSTNFQEIMAETWSAYQLQENPGDFVRELGGLMEEALQRHIEDSPKRVNGKI